MEDMHSNNAEQVGNGNAPDHDMRGVQVFAAVIALTRQGRLIWDEVPQPAGSRETVLTATTRTGATLTLAAAPSLDSLTWTDGTQSTTWSACGQAREEGNLCDLSHVVREVVNDREWKKREAASAEVDRAVLESL